MSFVLDQVRRIDAQLDRLQLANLPSATLAAASEQTQDEDDGAEDLPRGGDVLPSKRTIALQAAIRGLSPGHSDSTSRSLLRPSQIQVLLSALSEKGAEGGTVSSSSKEEVAAGDGAGQISVGGSGQSLNKDEQFEQELEWHLVSKATTQVYGHVLSTILDEAVRLSDDIWYWDEVLGSQRYTALYSIQISPLRLYSWGSAVWDDVKARGGDFSISGAGREAGDTLTARWKQFYDLVRQVVKEKSVKEVHKQMLSPVTRVRGEVRAKQRALKKVRMRNANALGVLLGEGLANESSHGEGVVSPAATQDVQQKWRASVARNVALMEAVLAKINDTETSVDKFDSAVAELTDEDPLYNMESHDVTLPPQAVAKRLSRVLALGLTQYASSSKALVAQHGKPSKLIRYWVPLTVGLISSSTALRILVNRQAEILQWVQDLGATAVDFWHNWVVDPTRNLIRTIRHDEGSEISIMSKRSLEGDRESLERMVIDFAIDNPTSSSSSTSLNESEVADLRAKVREGDLTPVLKAYEKDLTSPLMGAVRGNLIRALLIQIQKTKVDVEIAMGGIDSLLKSQELLIGFISLTPGLLITYSLYTYLRTSFSTKHSTRAQRKQGQMVKQLRNIDRILTSASPTEYGELLYRDMGLLLCEVHVLRLEAGRIMPAETFRDFGVEVEELCDVRVGVERQRRVLQRVRWAYGRWLG